MKPPSPPSPAQLRKWRMNQTPNDAEMKHRHLNHKIRRGIMRKEAAGRLLTLLERPTTDEAVARLARTWAAWEMESGICKRSPSSDYLFGLTHLLRLP